MQPTQPSSQRTLLGWSSPSLRDTQLDLPPPLDESVRTSLALVLYQPPAPAPDDSLFSRCVIEEPPSPSRRRSRRGTWIAAASAFAAAALAAALILLGGAGGALLASSGGSAVKREFARSASWWSDASGRPRVSPEPAPEASPAQDSSTTREAVSPKLERRAAPPRPSRRGLEVRVHRGKGVVEIWLRDG